MRFLIDENLSGNFPGNPYQLLTSAGHDAVTVPMELLQGAPDSLVIKHCQEEQRILITLDRDFGNLREYRPSRTPGIILICLGREMSPLKITLAIKRVIATCSRRNPAGKLWLFTPNNFLECPRGISKSKLTQLVKRVLSKDPQKRPEKPRANVRKRKLLPKPRLGGYRGVRRAI